MDGKPLESVLRFGCRYYYSTLVIDDSFPSLQSMLYGLQVQPEQEHSTVSRTKHPALLDVTEGVYIFIL